MTVRTADARRRDLDDGVVWMLQLGHVGFLDGDLVWPLVKQRLHLA